MSGLSTEDVNVSAGGLSKTIQPGNVKAAIRDVELSQRSELAKKKNGYYVVLHLETPKIEGFEGFFIDVKNEEKGRWLGQVGRVKTHTWPYSDGETKTGQKINRDMDIMRMIKRICIALGPEAEKWFDVDANNKYDTIEDFIKGFNESGLYKDRWMNWCIACREWRKDNGHIGQDLYLPKFSRDGVPFESIAVEEAESKMLKFVEATHLEKVEGQPVAQFAGDGDGDANGTTAAASAEGGADDPFEV